MIQSGEEEILVEEGQRSEFRLHISSLIMITLSQPNGPGKSNQIHKDLMSWTGVTGEGGSRR